MSDEEEGTRWTRDKEEGEVVEEEWAPHVVDYGYYCPLKSGSIDGTDKLPHDHAIVRALNSSYTSNKQVKGDPEKTLFVARLSHDTTEDVLRNAFAKYGEIESCRLVRDIVTGRSKGYGFIEFSHWRDMDRAYHDCHRMFLDGAQLVVDYECERVLPGWVPRRLGGGLGGRKESGQLRFGGRERPFKKPIKLDSKHLGRRRDGENGGSGFGRGWRGRGSYREQSRPSYSSSRREGRTYSRN